MHCEKPSADTEIQCMRTWSIPCAWSHILPAAKVLPHLLEEVRSEQLQQLVLPLVIHILGKQDKQVRPNLAQVAHIPTQHATQPCYSQFTVR